jgi:glycosyltransferase involved in cell wall biosynthesis
MRVLHCIWRMAIGGAERQLVYLTEALTRRGVDVQVAVAFSTPHDDQLRRAGATLHELRGAAKYDLRVLPRLAALMRRLQPDVVQTWMQPMDVAGGAAALMLGIPLIIAERCAAQLYTPSVVHRFRAAIGKRAAFVVANSAEGERYWRDVVKRSGAIERIPNIAPPPIEIAHRDNTIVTVARFAPQKNLTRLAAAMRIVVGQADVTPVLIGDGPDRRAVEAELDGTGAIFPGVVPDAMAWIARAAAVVSVSRFEGEPNVALEAIRCSTPLVLSDIPSHRALVDDSSARFVDEDSEADIAEGILDVIRDPAGAKRRAMNAVKTLIGRSPEDVAERYVVLYSAANAHRLRRGRL